MNVAALVTGLKAVNSEVLQAQKNIASLQTGAKSLTDAQNKAAKSVEQLTKGYLSLKAGLGDVTKAFTSFEGIVGLFGGTIGTKAIGVTIEYNKTLLELSQQARMSGRSFAEMRSAITLTSEKTALSEVEAAKFYQTLNEGLKTLTVSGRMVRELASDLSTAFGPALEDVNRGAQTLINIQSKIPDIFNDIRSSMPNNQYKEYILNLVQLGKMSAQEADAVLRTRKAHQEGAGALTKEQQELRKLQEIKQEFQKGLQQFMLAVGKPLADIMKNLGTAVKPLFEYINNFLQKEEVQQFMKLLMKGGAIVLTGKMLMTAAGGASNIFGGISGLLGKKVQDVNIVSVEGGSAKGILGGGLGGAAEAAAGGGKLAGLLKGVQGIISRAPLAIGGYMAASAGGSYMRGQTDKLGQGFLGTAAGSAVENLSSAGKGAAAGFAVGGPQGAAIGAVAYGFAEAGNSMINVLGFVTDKLQGFGEVAEESQVRQNTFSENAGAMGRKLSAMSEDMTGVDYALAAVPAIGPLLTYIKKDVEHGTKYDTAETRLRREGENEARNQANIPIQQKRLEEIFSKMGEGEKAAFGIDTGATEEKQKKQYYETVKERHLEKGGKEGDFSMVQTAKTLGTEKEKKALAEDELKINAAQFALREQNIALQQSEIAYQNTLLDIGNRYGQSVGSAQSQIDESVKALSKQAEEQKTILSMTVDNVKKKEDELKQAEAAEKVAIDGKKAPIEINKLTTNRIAAETRLKQLKQEEKDAGTKLRTLEAQRLDQIYKIREAVGSIVTANKELIEYEAMYGRDLGKVNELNKSSREELNKQVDGYEKLSISLEKELEDLIASKASQKDIDDQTNKIKLNHAEIAKTQSQINQLYKNALIPLENRRNVVDAQLSMEEANLELNKSINGGLGATLEIRSRIYEKIQEGIGTQDKIIAGLQQEIDLAKSQNKENLEAEARLNQEVAKRTGYIQKQVELTKSMRDGYLDALQSFQQVEGTFSKIIMTRESGLGEAMRKGMAAQGFTAGAIGAGGQGPVMKRNPDGSVTMPTNEMLQNVWKQYEGKYDPNRPQVLGIESSAAGALKEQGLESQFTGGQFGPQSSMYGKVRPTEGTGSQNIVLDKKFTKNIVNPSPEEVGRSLKVGADQAAGPAKTGEAKKAVEDSFKTPMMEATFPIVDELKKINETLMKGLTPVQAAGAPGAIGAPGAKGPEEVFSGVSAEIMDKLHNPESKSGASKAEIKAGVVAALKSSSDQMAKTVEKVGNQVKQGVKEGQKEAKKEPVQEAFNFAGKYREEMARDAEVRNATWQKSNKETGMSAMARTMNTSGVGGKGIQYNEKQILKVAEAEKQREKALSSLDKKHEENTKSIAKQAGKTVSEVQKEVTKPETVTAAKGNLFGEKGSMTKGEAAELIKILSTKAPTARELGKEEIGQEKKGAEEALKSKYALKAGVSEEDLKAKYAPKDIKTSDTIKYQEENNRQNAEQTAQLQKIAEATSSTASSVAAANSGERTNLNTPPGYASGGMVPGQGTGDRIPAMLEPKEFVVNKKAAQKYAGFLHMINAKGYADGGSVGYAALAGGGGVGGGPKININVRGDSAKKIMDEVGQSLSGVLNDMMTSHGGSGRYYDLPKSG